MTRGIHLLANVFPKPFGDGLRPKMQHANVSAPIWQNACLRAARWLDMPDLVAMRLPLPTMVQHDRGDDLFSLEPAEQGLREVGEAFAKAGAARSWAAECFEGPHKFDADMQAKAFAFFDRWLAQPGDAAAGGGGAELAGLRASMAEGRAAARGRLEDELRALEARREELHRVLAGL